MTTKTELATLLEAYRELRKAIKAHRDKCATSAEGCDPWCCGIYLEETVDAIDKALGKTKDI